MSKKEQSDEGHDEYPFKESLTTKKALLNEDDFMAELEANSALTQ